SHFFDLVIGKILTSRLSLSKHLAHNLGNLLLLGKIGVFHNRRNASSRLLLLISKHLILCIYLRSEDGSAGMPRPISYAVFCLKVSAPTFTLFPYTTLFRSRVISLIWSLVKY